ncbi:fibronectin type III domain-containing protein [Bifidobacterium tissieri]|uniref:Fibronectin type III domain-containing protein n=1 Tax=Bifidobacterium tissieri TaxID=1630162 RepID=A0A5M9ZMG7_9BIFI|nr:Ig-like domain-containing protein [Bifidobacterium tissieri]KAA8828846.1 fibronectin type III domain-containing protein [Bifidobacterium tissieri]
MGRENRSTAHSTLRGVRRRGPLAPFLRNRWLAPLIGLLLVIGIVVGAIIVESITRRHVQLDDGTVWVTSISNQKAARFNVRLKEADASVSSSAASFDVGQSGSDTVLTEDSQALQIMASTVAVDGHTDLRADTQTVVAGSTVAFINTKTGNVWVGDAGKVDAVTPTTGSPVMKLGSGGRIAVDHRGVVYGYRPADAMVLVLDDPRGSVREWGSLNDGQRLNADDFTVVSDTPVVASDTTLITPKGKAKLPITGKATLQDPPTDDVQSGWVAAASTTGLYLVDLNRPASDPTALAAGGQGEAARPVSSGGCVWAAWSRNADNFLKTCDVNGGDASGKDARFVTLKEIDATSQLRFRTNHRLVVLNDMTDGKVWNPDDSTNAIKLQWDQIRSENPTTSRESQNTADNHRDFAQTCSAASGSIRAVDDTFGARAGGEQILDVLRNDEQTDCSVLHIEKVESPGGGVSIAPVYDGRYLQLDATQAGTGTVRFSYSISDGHGQSSSATVTLNITSADGDHAPEQTDVPPEYQVEQGATYTANALASFSDDDGDPMTLVSANPTNSEQVMVSTRPDGQLVFNTGSQTTGRVAVNVTVSDGEQTGTGTVYFSIRPANTLSPVIDPVVKQTQPGTSTTVDLKPYVHGNSTQPVQLGSVSQPDGATATANAETMSFTFTAANPGTYYVPYSILQGSKQSTGLARVEVAKAGGDSSKPVATNDVALLGDGNTAIVEPLSNDVDPLGGVLAVTSVSVDPATGIKAGIVGNKRVYLTARQTPSKPVSVSYTVANAQGTSEGRIVLQPPASASQSSAPKAGNINAQVRTGGIVTVDVMNHVTAAGTVTLDTDLTYDRQTLPGLVFVSGDTVRYQAGDQEGSFPVTYTVRDSLGNTASGTITFAVHASDAEGKSAPTPADVTAQVAAGDKVRIPIDLTGIDVDGDGDTLNGLGNTVPSLGRVTEVGADYLIYEAYADSSGTDTFTYAVEDWTGQRAQAQIRVGVFRGGSDSGVFARDDTIAVRPGTKVDVPVLLNDISGDDENLTLDKQLSVQGLDSATVKDDMVEFTAPDSPGTAYVMYTARTKAGLTDTATLSVTVAADAPISPPTAYDYKVPASATVDKRTVDVDVRDWIANPSGSVDDLEVNVDASASDHARRKGGTSSTTISVDLTDAARAVPYTVTNTRYHVTSTAFIQVPAYGVFPPTLRPKAPDLTVRAGETIDIPIADHVRVGAGKTALIASKDSVSATKSDGGNLYVNETTLRFTAAKDYSGPASITFTAVDGRKSKGTIVNSAVLTLPITVVGKDAPAPTFSSPTVDVVPGEDAKTISLSAFTKAPDGSDASSYAYSSSGLSTPVSATVAKNGELTVSAPKDAKPGTTVNLPLTIDYGSGQLKTGVTLRVTQTDRPLARVPDVSVKVKAGETQQVNVLRDAYNPFPDTPLKLVGASSEGSHVSVEYAQDGMVSITAAQDAPASTNRVVVTAEDGTGDTSRRVSATITVSVVGLPDAPLLSPVTDLPSDGTVSLSWTPGSANGSPIVEYQVEYDGGSVSCGTNTSCRVTGLENGREYSFTVRARNEVGWSKPSNTVKATPDRVPAAPGGVTVTGGYHAVTVNWSAPGADGGVPESYTVTINGAGGTQTQTVSGTSATFSVDNNAGGAAFSATVKAHNRAGDGPEAMSGQPGTPWGDIDPPSLTLEQSGDTIRGTIDEINDHGAGCASVTVSRGGPVSCTERSFSFTIDKSEYFKDVSVSVTVTPSREGTHGATVSQTIVPQTEVARPDLQVSANGGTCTATWKANGLFDSVSVRFGDKSSGDANGSLNVDLSPWTSCPTATATQSLNGHAGQTVTAGEPTGYVYKVAPTIDANGFWLEWDGADRNHLVVRNTNGSAVNTYGKEPVVELSVDGAAVPNASVTDGTVIDLSQMNAPADPSKWRLKVSLKGEDASLNADSGDQTIRGIRPTASTISYLTDDGRFVTQPTTTPTAAYLVRFRMSS